MEALQELDLLILAPTHSFSALVESKMEQFPATKFRSNWSFKSYLNNFCHSQYMQNKIINPSLVLKYLPETSLVYFFLPFPSAK